MLCDLLSRRLTMCLRPEYFSLFNDVFISTFKQKHTDTNRTKMLQTLTVSTNGVLYNRSIVFYTRLYGKKMLGLAADIVICILYHTFVAQRDIVYFLFIYFITSHRHIDLYFIEFFFSFVFGYYY